MRATHALVVATLLWTAPAPAAAPFPGMIQLTVKNQRIEGMPLAWNKSVVHLLGRDGRLWQVDPDQATHFRKSSHHFRSYTVSELRAMLLRELGRDYEISGTSHYLVAHARGERDRWARRFEGLYRSFVHYFRVRGFRVKDPPFPLIGIVCKDRRAFRRYAAEQGSPMPGGVMGFYSPHTNRIILYDMGEQDRSGDWQQTAKVIIHEATHQTAFNTGIHSRYTPPPLWVAEGLATMFEAPGVYDCRNHTRRRDRINRARLADFRQLVPRHRPELLSALLASDKLFRSRPAAAYAEAWALSFYLVETQPGKYAKYLALTAEREPFADYTAGERLGDFTAVFGGDWRMLEARFLRFMGEVK